MVFAAGDVMIHGNVQAMVVATGIRNTSLDKGIMDQCTVLKHAYAIL